jgi:hypothetical protein
MDSRGTSCQDSNNQTGKVIILGGTVQRLNDLGKTYCDADDDIPF